MKIWKKSIIIIILIISISIYWYYLNKQKQIKIEQENNEKLSYTVKLWDIKNEVKVKATAKLANEQKLSFWQEGKITEVFVDVWDEVKAWDVLAELSMDDYEKSVKTAKLELENANIWLNKLINNDTWVQQAQIKSQINDTKNNYSNGIEQLNVTTQQLQTNLQQKKDQLQQLIRDYEINEKNLEVAKSWLEVNTQIETEQTQDLIVSRQQTINSIVNSLNSTLWDVEYIIESVDKIFWISPEFKDNNDYYDNYLWIKDWNLKNQVKIDVNNWYIFLNNYSEKFKNINSEMSDDEIYDIIQKYYEDSNILVIICDNALDSVDQSIESLWSLSDTMIDLFISNINSSRTLALTLRSKLETFSSSITSLLSSSSQENQLEISLEQKSLEVKKLETNINNQKENILLLNQEIKNLENDNVNQINKLKAQNTSLLQNIDVLNKQLNDLLDWTDINDIKQQKNLIDQAEIRLEKVIDQKDDYQIIAEFNWRVRSVDIIKWEQYKLEDRSYIIVENPNLIELELQVSQIDVVKINEDDPVIITFDAYPNTPIIAKLTNRNVNPETNDRGSIYYKATILLDKQNIEILAWMTAIVSIITDQAFNVPLIPSLSITQNGEKKYVYIKFWEEYKALEIKTWVTNNFQSEVKDWLKQWDKIKASVLDNEELEKMWINEKSDSVF